MMRDRARWLRRQSTPAEQLLWSRLRARQLNGARFRRQHPIGPFITDFCCLEQRLIIELDGGQHISRGAYDDERSTFLRSLGYRVLRLWNDRVLLEPDAAIHEIRAMLH